MILAGCQTMLAGDRALGEFLDATGADGIRGYRISPNLIRSAALDLLLSQALAERADLERRAPPAEFVGRFHRDNAELARATGFG